MKITPKQYAQALYESVQGKSKEESKQIIKDFAKLLFDSNNLKKADAVQDEFLKLWNKENKIVDAKITSANEIADAELKTIIEYIKRISSADTVNHKHQLNKGLLGGVVMKYGDKILDGSLKTQLEALKNRMKS